MPSYPSQGPIDAGVEVGVGYVEVIAAERGDVTVDVTPTRPGRNGDVSLAAETAVTFEGGRLHVRVPRRFNLFGQSDSVDVRIGLPAGSRLAVESAYGSVRTRGTLGDGRIVAKYGSVSGETFGDLTLDAPYGTVDVDEVTGDLDADVGYGRLSVGRVGGKARVRASHGVTDLGTVGGAADVVTSGALTIGRALTDVTARGAHGAIRVREVTGGSVRLENGYGDVEVGVPQALAAWVDAASAHGAVRNELTPGPDAAAGEGSVELRLRANYGSVTIRRALAIQPTEGSR
jgi:hypothetical protein